MTVCHISEAPGISTQAPNVCMDLQCYWVQARFWEQLEEMQTHVFVSGRVPTFSPQCGKCSCVKQLMVTRVSFLTTPGFNSRCCRWVERDPKALLCSSLISKCLGVGLPCVISGVGLLMSGTGPDSDLTESLKCIGAGRGCLHSPGQRRAQKGLEGLPMST